MAHRHLYKTSSFDKHYLVCANKRFGCPEPQVRDVEFNCGECPWCRAHPQTKPAS